MFNLTYSEIVTVVRGIFGPTREAVAGSWRRLYNEMGGVCSSHGRNAYRILVGKPERKRPFFRPRCRWEGNIKMYFKEIGYEGADWVYLAQDRDQ
jgi:hypothetical protein